MTLLHKYYSWNKIKTRVLTSLKVTNVCWNALDLQLIWNELPRLPLTPKDKHESVESATLKTIQMQSKSRLYGSEWSMALNISGHSLSLSDSFSPAGERVQVAVAPVLQQVAAHCTAWIHMKFFTPESILNRDQDAGTLVLYAWHDHHFFYFISSSACAGRIIILVIFK